MTDIVIDQSPQKATLIFVAGDVLEFSVTIVDPDPDSPDPDNPVMIPRNLTGWTVAAQIRKKKGVFPDNPVIAVFSFNVLDSTGQIDAELTKTESEKLRVIKSGFWDYQLTDPAGKPRTLMAGPAQPDPDVTA